MAEKDEVTPEALDALLSSEGEDLDRDDDQADFEAAFNGDDDPEPREGPKEVEEPKEDPQEDSEGKEGSEGDEKPKDSPAPDPLQAAMDRIQSLERQLRDVNGKFGGLNAQLQQAKKAAPPPPPKETPNLKKYIEEWGDDWGQAMNEHAEQIEDRIFQKLPQTGVVTKEMLNEVMNATLHEFRQEITVDRTHPGWKDTLQTPEFKSWWVTQGDDIHALDDGHAANTIRIFDSYNAFRDAERTRLEKEQEALRKQERLKRGVPPTASKSRAEPPAPTEEDDFNSEF